MMDTDILFRDVRRFNSDYNNMPSLIASDSVDSTSCDGVDNETFTSGLCSWNYNSGTVNDLELILGSFGFDPISDDDFRSTVGEWENTVPENVATLDVKPLFPELQALNQETDGIAHDTKSFLPDLDILKEETDSIGERKPLLDEFDILKEDTNNIKKLEKTEPNTSNIDTHYNVEQMKNDIPELFEITSVPFFDYSDLPEDTATNSLLANDLPANLDLCSFINGDDIIVPSEVNVPKDVTTPEENKIEDNKEVKTKLIPSEVNVPNNVTTKDTKIKNNKEVLKPKFKAGRKRIDLKARKYIVDEELAEEEEEEHVDVETISENGNNPVLEARDLDSLLEQFEASEVNNEEPTSDQIVTNDVVPKKEKPTVNSSKISNDHISSTKKNKQNNKKSNEQNKKQAEGALPDASMRAETSSPAPQKVHLEPKYVNKKTEQKKGKVQSLKPSNNKQIIEALPQELINRIKESGKRKRIAIIDPVPNSGIKKRKIQESAAVVQAPSNAVSDQIKFARYSVELDHNYCATAPQYPIKRTPKKDSGYLTPEEEEKVIHNQPVVKNADGKLMISLLKVNTIRSNLEENKKKKLNIEEYKKRRQGILNTPTSSQSNSPMSSTCSSPLPEDENTKRLKHEEKLRKMALELLSTPPKSCSNTPKSTPNNPVVLPKRAIVQPPPDMDVITYVSIGVNTDISGTNPLTQAAEKLEEIKPLLQNASVKISSNSLINSLIQNIPKVIQTDAAATPAIAKCEHGEDKTVIYLPKNRKLPQTADVSVQTSLTLLEDNKRRYRRRRDSSSSTSSSSSGVRSSVRSNKSQGSKYSKSSRSFRSTSTSSSSSSSTSRSSIRTRSRSPSPQVRRKKQTYDREYVQEVEERRVVYVGKIAPKTTKQDLYRRFSRFGPIKTISLHFRDHGDNYGFVTFEHNLDAYEAIEHGNDDPYDIQYDLSFGGRRLFCKTTYSDLDNMRDDSGYGGFISSSKSSSGDSFDRLLKEMQEKLKRRKV
ncbi:hypothetical protein HHI36_007218 [Cryptolaemus montrouzieri]|uniref:RRM domain-containing protein n=1 Tax=Cryptolaemus montrouzieri TaxID=559131 RepID=A0ABD2MPR3_9CUCU